MNKNTYYKMRTENITRNYKISYCVSYNKIHIEANEIATKRNIAVES